MSSFEIIATSISGISAIYAGVICIRNFLRDRAERLEREEKEKREQELKNMEEIFKNKMESRIENVNHNIEMLCGALGVHIVDVAPEQPLENEHQSLNAVEEEQPQEYQQLETPSEFELQGVIYNRRDKNIYINDPRYIKHSADPY